MINFYFEIITTENCNWGCSYCNYANITDGKEIFDNYQNTYIESIVLLRKVLDTLKNKDYTYQVLVQGGEIGLLPKWKLELLFKNLDERGLIISTNGKFLQNKYDEVFDEYINVIHYHCIEDYDKPLTYNYYKNSKVIEGIVLTKFNTEIIDDIIQDYQKIKYIDFEVPLHTNYTNEVHDKITHCRKYIKQRYTSLYDNVDSNIKAFDQLQLQRKACKQFTNTIVIDLVNNTLNLCSIKNKHINIPFTMENIKKLITSYNVFNYKHTFDNCDTCIRNCHAVYIKSINNLINNKKKLEKVFI